MSHVLALVFVGFVLVALLVLNVKKLNRMEADERDAFKAQLRPGLIVPLSLLWFGASFGLLLAVTGVAKGDSGLATAGFVLALVAGSAAFGIGRWRR